MSGLCVNNNPAHLLLHKKSLKPAHHEDRHSPHHGFLLGRDGHVALRSIVELDAPLVHRYATHEQGHTVLFDEPHHFHAPCFHWGEVVSIWENDFVLLREISSLDRAHCYQHGAKRIVFWCKKFTKMIVFSNKILDVLHIIYFEVYYSDGPH